MGKHEIVFCLGLGISAGLFVGLLFVNPNEGKILFSELVLQLSGSSGKFPLGCSVTELTGFAMRLVPAFVGECCFGICFYKRFCTASVYVFSRCVQKRRWYRLEIGHIICRVAVFQGSILAGAILSVVLRFPIVMDNMVIAVFYWLSWIIWTGTMILAMNLTAVYVGSSFAFAGIITLQILFLALMGTGYSTTASGEGILRIMMVCNPIARLVTGWHNGYGTALGRVIPANDFMFSPCHTIIMFSVIFAAVSFAGEWLIMNRDILVTNMEEGAW